MARKSRRERRTSPSKPPSIARQPRLRPGSEAAGNQAAAGAVRAMTEAEDLGEAYSHVRRDLWRILIFAVLLFAAIFGSQFV